ncbi:hypothetical protein FRC02_011372 [Tulasnella sp. 418]|nr:hypothetical protein FRC02_011372 [Tulasnella sp. 418]
MVILGLESSADDTCAAIVDSKERKILSSIVIGQGDSHHTYQGIMPRQAMDLHQRNMPIAIQRALAEAKLTMNDIDGIAFTRGPGMGGCLSICSTVGRAMGAALNKPIVGVHHMQAHALTHLLTEPNPPGFPFLTLLVSGGHTMMVLAQSPTSFKIIASTGDTSIGQAFDRVARNLDVPWYITIPSADGEPQRKMLGPGAALEQLALSTPSSGQPIPYIAPFPIPQRGLLALSYSGPSSYVTRLIESLTPEQREDEGMRIAIARRWQESAVGQLEEKLALALKQLELEGINVTSLVVSGGVASNMFLRERLRISLNNNDYTIPVIFPPPKLCTDNAAMIAWAASYRFANADYDPYDIRHKAVWPLEDLALEQTQI